MAVINEETADFWRDIAAKASAQRPVPGKRVRVTESRKHKGKLGTVLRHMQDRFVDAFRYGGEANLHMREIEGRYGYVVLVRDDSGAEFWIKADKVEVL